MDGFAVRALDPALKGKVCRATESKIYSGGFINKVVVYGAFAMI